MAGVCAGLAESIGIDPTIVRVLWVILTFGYGIGLLVYILAWIFIPEE